LFEVSYEDDDVETMNPKEVEDLAKRGAARPTSSKRRVLRGFQITLSQEIPTSIK
jgi:hypothetical protein